MKNKLKSLISILITLFVFGVNNSKANEGYYPLKIVNKAANSKNVEHTYILMMAQDWTKEANNCVLSLTYDATRNAQVATLVPITSSSNSNDYTYALDSLQGYDTTTQSILIYVPHLQSGRCMVSMNYKLYMPLVTGSDGKISFQNPSVSDTSDVNFDIVYDKFEFTYDNTTPGNGCFYIDPTAVDFFSIPIKMEMGSQKSGNINNTERKVLIDSITTTLQKYDNTTDKTWSSIVYSKDGSVIRVISPSLAISFDQNYLSDTTSYDYIDTLIKYYKTNTLYVNCAEVGGGYYGGSIDTNNNWNFINGNDTVVIDMDSLKSYNFFGPGTFPFDTPNKTVKSIIVKDITAAFTVNMLPAPNGDTLNKPYNSNNFYKTNPLQNAPTNSGPWYNLYTRAMHSAVPVMYAFAYDDVLGQDGTLSGRDTTQTAVVTIGDLGDMNIPKHKGLLHVYAVTVKTNTGFICDGDSCRLRVTWQNPPTTTAPYIQPENAKYFIMIAGTDNSGFNIPADSIVSLQKGKFYSYTDTCGVLVLSQSVLTGDPSLTPVQVMACGGPESPSTGPSSDIRKNAHGSNLLAPNVKKPKKKCSCEVSPPSDCNLKCVLRRIWCWIFKCQID